MPLKEDVTIAQLREANKALRGAINKALNAYGEVIGALPRDIKIIPIVHRDGRKDDTVAVQVMYVSIEIEPPYI